MLFPVYDDTTPFGPKQYNEVVPNVLCILRYLTAGSA